MLGICLERLLWVLCDVVSTKQRSSIVGHPAGSLSCWQTRFVCVSFKTSCCSDVQLVVVPLGFLWDVHAAAGKEVSYSRTSSSQQEKFPT